MSIKFLVPLSLSSFFLFYKISLDMNVYKFVLYFIKFLKSFYVESCLQALFSPSIVFRYQENCIFVLFSNVDLKYNSIRFDLFMLHMST